MKIPKASASDRQWFASVVPEDPRVEVRPMFGNVAAFVNGNMFMGLFGPNLGLRLPADDRRNLGSVPGTGPFGPEGRPMKEYISLPDDWRASPDQVSLWVDRALDHVAAMPLKAKSPKRN